MQNTERRSTGGFPSDEAGRSLAVVTVPLAAVVAVVHQRLLRKAVAEAEDLLEGGEELLAEPAVQDEVAGRLHRQHDQRYIMHQLWTTRRHKMHQLWTTRQHKMHQLWTMRQQLWTMRQHLSLIHISEPTRRA